MQKLVSFSLLAFMLIFTACHTEQKPVTVTHKPSDTTNIFAVTSFLKGQLNMIDTLPITPLKTISENGKTDSAWLKREDIRKNAIPFLSPVIDSANMTSLFSEKSFLDQTINAYTFSYDAKVTLPDSIKLTHWDVYMNPQTNNIERIYMVKETGDTTIQLTWLVNKSYSIRTIVQEPGKKPKMKEEKMIWNFDD
ncbi:MAG TPA: hypothetical protein VN722_06100 [Hanamia sp.]|jgi:hypothetical protein|nr:hypothetical protein [Hanamia sp.]